MFDLQLQQVIHKWFVLTNSTIKYWNICEVNWHFKLIYNSSGFSRRRHLQSTCVNNIKDACSWLYLAVSGCTWLHLSAPGCVYMALPGTKYHIQPGTARYNHVEFLIHPWFNNVNNLKLYSSIVINPVLSSLNKINDETDIIDKGI